MKRRLFLAASGFFMSVAERLAEIAAEDLDLRRRIRWSLEQRHQKLQAEFDGEAWNVQACGTQRLRLVVGRHPEDQRLIANLKAANAEQAAVIKVLSVAPPVPDVLRQFSRVDGMRLQ